MHAAHMLAGFGAMPTPHRQHATTEGVLTGAYILPVSVVVARCSQAQAGHAYHSLSAGRRCLATTACAGMPPGMPSQLDASAATALRGGTRRQARDARTYGGWLQR